MDAHAASWFELSPKMNQMLLASRINGQAIDFGALACGYNPVDLGSLGYCLELALRPGVQHSATESQYNFERALPMAASLVSTPLLVRADSGFYSARLMQEVTSQAATLQRKIALITKWNPRQAPMEAIVAQKTADANTQWVTTRHLQNYLAV
jgi:hypothetical protein